MDGKLNANYNVFEDALYDPLGGKELRGRKTTSIPASPDSPFEKIFVPEH